MRLRLLGPLEVVMDRRSLDIGGPRQRVVLSMLALNANRVTPVEQLIDAVWDTAPPSTARSQIQIAISALRKLVTEAGRPGAISTRAPGYLLEIADGELDSEEFARLTGQAKGHAEAGRITEAADTLRTALGLWRGPALAGVPSDLVQRGAALLEDRRHAAEEERVRIDLTLGRHEEICGELQALVDEQPLRERLYGFLMLALYRSGRQAEALAVCRRARNTLIDEVGIEPGQELRDLEHQILNRDPVLDPPGSVRSTVSVAPQPVLEPAPVGPPIPAMPQPVPARSQDLPGGGQLVTPRQMPAGIADFTGRQHYIAEIKRRLVGDVDGAVGPYAVRILGISGKGGVGKSSLAVRAAHELSDAFPDGHLYADFSSGTDDRTAGVLARFLRALGVAGSAVPEDAQERAEMYRSRLADKRLLVVLDDVTSEDQVLPLLPGSPSCAVITTSRVRMSGLSGAHLLDIDVFDREQSVELLARIVGEERVRAEYESSVELVDFCDGLPLALRIAGARLASKPHWRIRDLVRRLRNEARRLDELEHRGLELRSNIGLTYRALSREAQRLCRLFALIQAPDFPGWTAAALLDVDLLDAEDVLEVLVDAQVLDTVEYPSERLLRYRFHDLIRVYAGEKLLETESVAEREAALTRLLGAWLSLADQAHRKEYGGDFTTLHGSAPRWQPPDDEDTDSIGNPMSWWESERRALVAAIRQAASAGLDELCWDLALTSVTLFEARGYFDDWRETSQLALDVAERNGNRRGQAAMLYSMGSLHMSQKRLPDAERSFAAALDIFTAEGDEHGCALVLRNAAFVDRLQGRADDMRAKYAEALAKMRAVGDRIGEAHVLCNQARILIEDGAAAEQAGALLDEALVISRDVGCLRVEAQVLYRFAELHLQAEHLEPARESLNRVLRIVRDIGDRIGEAHALYGLGRVRHREGRLDTAETTMTHAHAAATRVGEPVVAAQSLYALGEIANAKGDRAVALTQLQAALAMFETLDAVLWQVRALSALAELWIADQNAADAQEALTKADKLLCALSPEEATGWRAQLATQSALLESTVTSWS